MKVENRKLDLMKGYCLSHNEEHIKLWSRCALNAKSFSLIFLEGEGSVTVDDAVESTPESTHNIFSSLQSGPFSPASTGDPYFDSTVPRNVTALVGKTAYLGCRVKNLGNRTVQVAEKALVQDVE
ncbi:hypothetical protein Fcan01_02427 [Folsomia candida]|uniref:Uncharacterized protein n=1 Tax=Folsomia candida TaxID=158441 RepID=A0A226F434_FOLCA|nr:hypothetical protein Fcan01_02427 [Folsomia candida]